MCARDRMPSPCARLRSRSSLLSSPPMPKPIRVADVSPLPVPADIVALRAQPAIGPTLTPVAPGQQPLTAALLANYVERQKALRAFDVLGAEPRANSIPKCCWVTSRAARWAATAPSRPLPASTSPAPKPEPALNPSSLAAYIETGYQPTEQRPEHANSERDCLAQAHLSRSPRRERSGPIGGGQCHRQPRPLRHEVPLGPCAA